ncbi:MAG: bL17 family ribosomal protein [archaeon]|nr:bL17 family ribosomal protein [archaeon]
MVTLTKQGTLAAKRRALAYLTEPSIVDKIFAEYPERYGQRPGGYTSVKMLSQLRKGDRAQMALIAMVDGPKYLPNGTMADGSGAPNPHVSPQPSHPYENLDDAPAPGSRVVM